MELNKTSTGTLKSTTKYFRSKLSFSFLIMIGLILIVKQTQAQSSGKATIKGLVITAGNKPLDYATVTLISPKDSTTVKAMLSTLAGSYSFQNIKPGNYIIKVSSIGFKPATSQVFIVGADATELTIPDITATLATRSLATVTISAPRPLIERQNDRLIVNVAGNILSAGNSALDILEKAPGVDVDKDGNISLNGKQGVLVMINDKLTYLSADQLATLLRSTDGSNIQSLEIISNPSSQYDAAGKAGIINIKLKKNKQDGTNGSLTIGAGQGHYFKDNASFTLNHKSGKLNLFSNFSHTNNHEYVKLSTNRIIDSANTKSYYAQSSTINNPVHTNSFRVGADYDLSDKNTAGFVAGGYRNSESNANDGTAFVGSQPGQFSTYRQSVSQADEIYHNASINVNDRFRIDTVGQQFNVDLDYAKFTYNSNERYATNYFLGDGATQFPSNYLRQQTPATISIHTAKADYIDPITKTLKVQAGIKLSDVNADNNLNAQTSTDNISYINDPQLSNHFIYQEKIDAAYFNLSKNYNSTSFTAGLRGEYTRASANLVDGGNAPLVQQYFNLFPAASLSHTFNARNEVRLGFGRRIDRPDYQDLNPFIYYIDEYTHKQGNPYLKAQYTNNLELSYTYHKTINLSLAYSRTTNVNIQTVLTDTVTKISTVTRVNFSSRSYYSLNINSPYTIFSWWTGNINGSFYYSKYISDNLLGSSFNKGKLAYTIKAAQNFQLSNNDRIELLSRYRSSQLYGFYYMEATSSVDAGVSHSFANKRTNLKFSISDIFNKDKTHLTINNPGSNFIGGQKLDTRIARITFTYNFGNNKIKREDRASATAEERKRAKGVDE